MPDGLVIARHGGAAARALRSSLVEVYRAASTPEELADPFLCVEAFTERLTRHLANAGYLLVTATSGDRLVGFLYGYTLGVDSRWFVGMQPPISPECERPLRAGKVLAICEINTVPECRRRGVATACHAEYLISRPEQYATLLVSPDNGPAYAAYAAWGYHKVGVLAPDPAHPYDAMVKPLTPPIEDYGTAP